MADDTPTYRIKDWDLHFENHQSRVLNHPRWVPFPNKHDGKSYKRIMRLPNGISIFGAWVLIVEVASKMPVRGVLVKDGESLTAEDLADKTGAPQSIFEEAFRVLSDPKIGWISAEFCTGDSQSVENSLSPTDCGTSKTALEGNRKTRNRTEKNRIPPLTKPRREQVSDDPNVEARSDLLTFLIEQIGPLRITGPQTKAINWLFEVGYSADECKRCLGYLLSQTWRGKAVTWQTVSDEIGAWKSRGEPGIFTTGNSNGHNGANGKTNYSSQSSNGHAARVGVEINTSLTSRIKRA